MARKITLLLASSISMMIPSLGFADPTPPSTPSTTISQLDALHDQIAVLKQQLQIAKLKAGISDAGKSGSGASAATPTGFPGIGYGQPRQSAPVTSAPQASMPRVVSIDGRGSSLSAVLMMPDGGEVVATPGLGLGDGLTVHDVTASGVRVMKAGNLLPLPFISTQASTQASPEPVAPVSVPTPLAYPPSLPGAGQ
ncbi:MAG: type IV pilus biogenesis protein PilP [Acidiphilium sp.]|nr:type IV pilus biogenesis protein PilP [Acidiphilium sp.]